MRCRICGNSTQNRSYEIKEMMFGFRDIFTYFQCSQCNCLQIKEIPPDISKYYPEKYYSFEPVEELRNPLKNLLKKMRDSYAIFNKGILGKLLFILYPNEKLRTLYKTNINKQSRILDVGCGSGLLLYSLKNIGFHSLLGIDPYINKDIRYENGLTILKKSVFQITEKWDLIMFNHSFEHISNPIETLQQCSELLNNGGVCLIRIPTVSSYAWNYYKANWVQLDAPRHFFLYSIDSINLLTQQSELRLEEIVFDSFEFQFWGSEQYLRDIPLRAENSYLNNPSKSIFTHSQIKSFKNKAKKMNLLKQGDQAAFYLRK